MNRYIVILRHGPGRKERIHISTVASTAHQALEMVCEFEGAPHSAVMSVVDKGPVYKQGEI